MQEARKQRVRKINIILEGGSMKISHGLKWALCLVLAGAWMACVPACVAQPKVHLDKHAHKIYKKLAKYRPGSYLHFELRNGTASDGSLGTLSATSFTFTNSESNAVETHSYDDVTRISKGKTYIGEGTAPRHHIHLF